MEPMNWSKHTSLPWLESRTILLVRHGSHAYGTNVATSDVDVKGVAVPPREYFHGFARKFEQAESHAPDSVIYDVRKFCQLARDCNPNIIEVLWGAPEEILICTEAGSELLAARSLFLSKKARFTFSGYAIAQLKRINTHHRWLRNPPTAPPTREEFGLPPEARIPPEQLQAVQSQIDKQMDSWTADFGPELDEAGKIAIRSRVSGYIAHLQITQDARWESAARTLGYDENFIHLLQREREYRNKLAEWGQFETWKKTRNPQRAELEARFGYDTKHGMHLVRLLRMCREILETGRVIVKRPDRDELLAIRNGAWSYERLVEWATAHDNALEEIYRRSELRHAPSVHEIDALCVRIVERTLSESR
jgi:predicted nucleotidyltransferase